MQRIRKSGEPVVLRTWRDEVKPKGSVPPWNTFPDPPRGAVRAQLAADQGQVCCYCAGAIARGNFHIEHFRPREGYSNLTYRWTNLLASCQVSRVTSTKLAVTETQLHCGAAKDNWFEDGITISPLEGSVAAMFRYTLRGKVFPSKSLRSRYIAVELTIEKLNLNAPALVARREEILRKASEDAATMTRAEWVAHYLDASGDGQLQEFRPALQYNYGKFWHDRLV